MTERAAERALNAIDAAQPIQDELARQANALRGRWEEWFASPIELDGARQLVVDTRGYLADVPQQAAAINAQLMEIMMAQDFQDLTGQVIKKMMDVVQDVEQQLLQLLIDNVPPEKRQETAGGLLNGPQIEAGRRRRGGRPGAGRRPAGQPGLLGSAGRSRTDGPRFPDPIGREAASLPSCSIDRREARARIISGTGARC